MRKLFFLVGIVGALVGCEPRDPVWDMACDARPKQAVEIGTGAGSFTALDGGPVAIQNGSQGGQHIWVSLRLQGFGPEVSATFGIVDAADASRVYSGPNSEHPELRYNAEMDRSEALGMYGYLTDQYDEATGNPLPGPAGKEVRFWVDVTDDCTSSGPVHAEATGKPQ